MKSKPITSKSKSSPLHNEKDGKKDSKKPNTLGAQTVYDADGYKLQANDAASSGTDGQPAVMATVLYSDLPPEKRQAARDHNMKKFGTHNPTAQGLTNNKVVVRDAVPGTDGERTTEYKPVFTEEKAADKVDVFLPWERRWAQRTQRGAVRDEIKRGKKGMRQLDKALKSGAITQDQYDNDYAEAQKLAFGQGVIAKGQYQNTAGMDAILSQGYQANPAVSTKTDMLRKPQAGQAAGQRVKADGTESMSQEEYENFGNQDGNVSTPKTSASVQDASKKAGASVPASKTSDASIIKIDGTSSSSDMFNGVESKDMGLMSDGPSSRTPQQPKDPIAQADAMFGEEGIVVKPSSSSTIGGKGIETDPMAGITNPTDDLPKMNESYGESIEDAIAIDTENAARAIEEELSSDRTAFQKRGYKMNRTHSPGMMYNKNAPTRKMGSPLNKLTDLSGDGEVTRKDVLIGRGVLNEDGSPLNKFASDAQRKAVWASKNEKAAAAKYKPTAFKMKGFGSKNKK
jgi:hypothetical protein